MMSQFKKFFNNNKLGFLSGFLLATSWIPFPPWALAFCLTPVWVEIYKQRENLKRVFWLGWFTQWTLSLIGFHWIAYVSKEFGFMPWPVAIAILLVFCSFMHIYFALSPVITSWLSKKRNLNPLGFFLSLACIQFFLETLWPSIFPWNMGYPLFWAKLPISQWADTIGFQGLSFLVYLTNALIAYLWVKRDKETTLQFGVAIVAVLLMLNLTGYAKQKFWQQIDPASHKTLKNLVIQGNIGNIVKLYAEQGRGFKSFIANEYFSLTRSGLKEHPDADLIIWPESAYPEILNSSNRLSSGNSFPSSFDQFILSIKKPILTGAYSKDPPEIKNQKDYNALFLFDSQAQSLSPPYHKTYLLVFGETIPFVEQFPWLAKYNPGGSGFGRGSGPMVMPFQDLQVGPQICYESLYPRFSSQLVKKGADLLVNLTNDSWFGPNFEPTQHMIMTLARAIEVRRPLIRSTNTGLTSAILADGTILPPGPLQQKWFGLFEINLMKNAPKTFYTHFGDWLLLPIFILFIIFIVFFRSPRAKN